KNTKATPGQRARPIRRSRLLRPGQAISRSAENRQSRACGLPFNLASRAAAVLRLATCSRSLPRSYLSFEVADFWKGPLNPRLEPDPPPYRRRPVPAQVVPLPLIGRERPDRSAPLKISPAEHIQPATGLTAVRPGHNHSEIARPGQRRPVPPQEQRPIPQTTSRRSQRKLSPFRHLVSPLTQPPHLRQN